MSDTPFQVFCHKRKFEALRRASCWTPEENANLTDVLSIGDTCARFVALGRNHETHNLVTTCKDIQSMGHELVSSVYIIGGETLAKGPVNTIHRWNPCGANCEVLGHTMPIKGASHTSVMLGHRIYLCGCGFKRNGLGGRVMVFDPAASTHSAWKVLSGVQGPYVHRAYPASAVLDGKLYLSGGANPNNLTEVYNTVERFDPNSTRWEILPPMKTHRGCAASAPYDNKLLVCGGYGMNLPHSIMQAAEVYDTVQRGWTGAPFMLKPRFNHKAAFVRGNVYVCGGVGGDTFPYASKSVEILCSGASAWSAIPDMLVPRNHAAVVVIGGKLFVFGGSTGHSGYLSRVAYLMSVELYDPQRHAWRAAPPMLEARAGFATAVVCRP